jgi:hypothetical protein
MREQALQLEGHARADEEDRDQEAEPDALKLDQEVPVRLAAGDLDDSSIPLWTPASVCVLASLGP